MISVFFNFLSKLLFLIFFRPLLCCLFFYSFFLYCIKFRLRYFSFGGFLLLIHQIHDGDLKNFNKYHIGWNSSESKAEFLSKMIFYNFFRQKLYKLMKYEAKNKISKAQILKNHFLMNFDEEFDLHKKIDSCSIVFSIHSGGPNSAFIDLLDVPFVEIGEQPIQTVGLNTKLDQISIIDKKQELLAGVLFLKKIKSKRIGFIRVDSGSPSNNDVSLNFLFKDQKVTRFFGSIANKEKIKLFPYLSVMGKGLDEKTSVYIGSPLEYSVKVHSDEILTKKIMNQIENFIFKIEKINPNLKYQVGIRTVFLNKI